ncbi:MAG: hypothetical protein [Bacteriophage sp.]|nr:MAG: hypothetical protein [Bacteriophage sp.]
MASQVDDQEGLNDFLKQILNHIYNRISVGQLGRVIKYDKKKHTATVLPLAKASNGEESAQLLDVPVAKSCYQVDELVKKLKPEFKKIDKYQNSKGGKINTNLVTKLPKPVLKKGAVVVMVFLDNDTDNWKLGTAKTFLPETNRRHDINDAIVVGVL